MIVVFVSFRDCITEDAKEKRLKPRDRSISFTKKLVVGAVAFGAALVVLLGKAALTFAPEKVAKLALWSDFGTVHEFANAMFGRYFYPFEIVALALTAAMIGAILLAKRDLEG